MKTDKDSKEIIMGVIILILLGLLMFTCSKNKPQILASSFSADNTTELQYERQNSQYLTEMIHAYNIE